MSVASHEVDALLRVLGVRRSQDVLGNTLGVVGLIYLARWAS